MNDFASTENTGLLKQSYETEALKRRQKKLAEKVKASGPNPDIDELETDAKKALSKGK